MPELNYLKNKSLNLLDCTLRDGGYYNNWDFSENLIQSYLNNLSKTRIKYIELGFRNFKQNKPLGVTGYTNDKLLNKLNIPKKLKIGIMINAGEFKKNKLSPLKNLKRLFPKINKKISFVRFACHFDEVFLLKDCIPWLNSKGIEVFVNIMQISEIKKNQVEKICKFLEKKNIKALYLADSLGSLNLKSFIKLTTIIRKNWKYDLGLHAHNNLKLALTNSLYAYKHSFNWIDSTVMGMGRGPGNLKTEDILSKFDRKNLKFIKRLIKNYFKRLKKNYKWGPNKYYEIAAKFKIHPTYIQEMLSEKKYNKKNYSIIINSLKKIDSRKYNKSRLFLPNGIYANKPNSSWYPKNILNKKNILIVGPGKIKKSEKLKLKNFVNSQNLFVIGVNTSRNVSEDLINLRTICHPKRMVSDASFHNKSKTVLTLPLSNLPEKLKAFLQTKNKIILDYGLQVNSNKKIIANKNYCSIPKPLVILYSLCIAISGNAKKIYVAGFEGYNKDNPLNDESDFYIRKIQKKYKNIYLRTLTKSKYKIKLNKI